MSESMANLFAIELGTFAIFSAMLAILVLGRCAYAVTQVIYFMKYDWFVAVTAAWSKLARKKMLS